MTTTTIIDSDAAILAARRAEVARRKAWIPGIIAVNGVERVVCEAFGVPGQEPDTYTLSGAEWSGPYVTRMPSGWVLREPGFEPRIVSVVVVREGRQG